MSRRARNPQQPVREWALEASLLMLTLLCIAGLQRVFSGGSWVLPLVAASLGGHVTAIAVRRAGRGMAASAALSFGGLALVLLWGRYLHTTAWGAPTGHTFTQLATELREAWGSYGDVPLPVEPSPGFVVSAMLALWAAGWLSDGIGLRVRSVAAVVPAAVLFVFAGTVGSGSGRVLLGAAFLAALLAFVVLHRTAVEARDVAWPQGAAPVGARALLGAGAALAVAALFVSTAAGQFIPDADESVVDWSRLSALEGGEGGRGRHVVSPLVDIRGRLVSNSSEEMFTVRSPERSYWRLTALDRFDGEVWGSRAPYASSAGDLPSLTESGTSTIPLEQTYTITGLDTVWLPMAFDPRRVESETPGIRYEASTSTLIVGDDADSASGIVYSVTSALPRFDPAVLDAVPHSPPSPGSEMASLLELPDNFSPAAAALAAQVTAGAASGYGKALALQDFFRSGGFIYSQNVPPGHSLNAIDWFLRVRAGYCEQFAGTYAAMARSVGLPSRVAVGFTYGEQDPQDPELFRVQGRHAHAWPEVFLPEAGWVAFEPTPGRGAPGAENHTGVPEQQATTGFGPGGDPSQQASSDAPFQEELFDDLAFLGDAELAAVPSTAASEGGGGIVLRVLWITGLVVVVLAGYPFTVRKLSETLRRARHRRAGNNRQRIGLMWSDTLERLASLNMTPGLGETHAEFAQRATGQLRLHGPDLRLLGDVAAAAAFGLSEPDDNARTRARVWSAWVNNEVHLRATWQQRALAAADPRPLFRAMRRLKRHPTGATS